MGAKNSQQRHEEDMKKLEMEAEKQRHEFEMRKREQEQKLKQANKELLQALIKQFDNQMGEVQTELEKLKIEESQLKTEEEKLKKQTNEFDSKRKEEIELWKKNKDYDKEESKLKRAEDEIKKAIEKTSLSEANVGTFLKLTQGLINATGINQMEGTKLAAAISVFGEILRRNMQKDLPIRTYFEEKLKKLSDRLLPIFEEENMDTMDDLICEDDEEWEEILELIQTGIKEQIKTYEENVKNQNKDEDNKNDDDEEKKPKPKKLTKMEIRKIKKICRKPEIWKDKQEEQIRVAKAILGNISPTLSTFFTKTHKTMEVADKILAISSGSSELSSIQQDSILYLKQKGENTKESKNQKNENTNNEIEETKENEENTKSDDNNKNDKERRVELRKKEEQQLTQVLDIQVLKTANQLNEAAIHSIHIVESMEKEFSDPKNKQARTIANSIQNSCVKLVTSQGNIRKSWVLANEICQLKPSNLSKESRELWDEVDKGIVHIFKNMIKMSEVSAKFFGFFMKFSNSFDYFISANKENVSLSISMQHVIQDTKDFRKFSKKFEKQVQELGDSALSVIQNCISKTAGAGTIETTIQERKDSQKKLVELRLELDELKKKKG